MRCHTVPVAAVLSLVSGLASAQSCAPVAFPAGYTTGAITGTAPADGVVCYRLDMAPHDANLRIEVEGTNVIFSYDDGFNAGDARQSVEMVPEGPAVEVRVGQLMRSATPQDFRLVVTFLPPGNG